MCFLLDLFPTNEKFGGTCDEIVAEVLGTKEVPPLSTRTSQSPWHFSTSNNNGNSGMPRRSMRAKRPNRKYAYVATLVDKVKEPATFEEATCITLWRQANKKQFKALLKQMD